MLELKVWDEKYRPKTLDDVLLPQATRQELEGLVGNKELGNLLFSGSPGIGKTTVAIALVEALGAEWIKINGSMKGGIDTLRNEIQQFAATIAFNGEKKYVIIDEADNLSHATQLALRGFIDEYKSNCGFIFTCNYRERIEDALVDSRLTEYSFVYSENEKPTLAKNVFKMLGQIATAESVAYKPEELRDFVVAQLRKSFDLRRIILLFQRMCISGTFVLGSDTILTDQRASPLIDAITKKDLKSVRTWVGENSDIEGNYVFRYIYDNWARLQSTVKVPELILILAKYQYQHNFVADKEINLTACCVELMMGTSK